MPPHRINRCHGLLTGTIRARGVRRARRRDTAQGSSAAGPTAAVGKAGRRMATTGPA